MHYVYKALEPEYAHLLSVCKLKTYRVDSCHERAEKILELKPQYARVSRETQVPTVWLMAINERESGSDMATYFGNGQPLNKRTTQVPKGRGPFKTWYAGARDALRIDHVDQVKTWSWPMLCFESELWNGFGPRMHGRHTGYLWGGTTIYDGGKYVEDGKWNARAIDLQLGTVPLMQALVRLDPSLDIGEHPAFVDRSPPRPVQHKDLAVDSIEWVQAALNKLQGEELDVDGSWGRTTARAVRKFQKAHSLLADGVPGDSTKAVLTAAMASNNVVL